MLGMLRRPASGYDLRKQFEEGPRHFWAARLSQIYPTLQRMERSRWLTSTTTPSPRGPQRRVYRRTAEGTRVLRRWLAGGAEVGAERLAWVGQLIFFGELRDPRRTLRFLRELRRTFASGLDLLESAEHHLRRVDRRSPARWDHDAFHEFLCIRMGVRVRRARLRACDEAIALTSSRLRRGRDET